MNENRREAFERLDSIADSLDEQILQRVSALVDAQGVDEQPWLILGCSDGMGLNTLIAALEARVLKHALGVYWEPEHFLQRNEDGTPVSPVHMARVENADALSEWARQRYGAEVEVEYANVILTPSRGLKGEPKGEVAELPQNLVDAFENVRERAPGDAVVINSVAFGKWISPRQDEAPITVPSVDFEGRIVEMSTKKYHPKGYEETLDTMGRNHRALLEAIVDRGWLGPRSLTAFYTWAGGSQNVESLEGIYGRAALGDAKLIAERDVARFRMEHPIDEYGAHAIVRLPAFLSAALMGIPGGGLFGLVSRHMLTEKGEFDDMPALASKMIRKLFGPEWVRENPISQIELDLAECLWIDEISANVEEAHRRIEAYDGDFPIDADRSAQLLDGLVPVHYRSILSRFRPGESNSALEFRCRADELTWGLPRRIFDALDLSQSTPTFERLSWSVSLPGEVHLQLWRGKERIDYLGSVDGREVVEGYCELGKPPESLEVDPAEIGTPVERFDGENEAADEVLAMAGGLSGSPTEIETRLASAMPTWPIVAYRRDEPGGTRFTIVDNKARVLAQMITR